MTDDILDFMRAWRREMTDEQAHVRRVLEELVARIGRLEREIANLHVDFAQMQTRIDHVNARLDRVERRLGLETPA